MGFQAFVVEKLKALVNFDVGPSRKELDILFNHMPAPSAPLSQRLQWMRDLMHWVLSESPLKIKGAESATAFGAASESSFESGRAQALRVKWLLFVTERNTEWELQLRVMMHSIASESRILDLLVKTGLHQKSGLLGEMTERLSRRFLPQAPDESNLEQFFVDTFTDEQDAKAMIRIEDESFQKIMSLFSSPRDTASGWLSELDEATEFLSVNIASLGFDASVRERLPSQRIEDNPFLKLHHLVIEWRAQQGNRELKIPVLRQHVQSCVLAISDLYSHMDEHGVSIDLVYHLERIQALLRRLESILPVFHSDRSPKSIKYLIASLVFESARMQSLWALFDDNTSLIAKKIAENSAETGDHYIARSPGELWELFKSALGGGMLTAVTTLLKFFILKLSLSPFGMGFAASLNYSSSFIVLQLRGFTLATKQPAMTAARLAREVEAENPDSEPLVREILSLIRSQFLAVLANLIGVIPIMILICFVYQFITKATLLPAEKALYTIESFSILGPTPFYAAWTGVLLFLSSIFAGWFHHWALYRRLPQAFGRSRRLTRWWGAERTRKFGVLFKKNGAGFAASISLGFLLGLSPVIAEFLGLPLDVRHVTLSTGSLAAAMMTLGAETFSKPLFWEAVAGIVSMGALNLTVSFALALSIALRAKRIPSEQANEILIALAKKILRNPTLLFRQ